MHVCRLQKLLALYSLLTEAKPSVYAGTEAVTWGGLTRAYLCMHISRSVLALESGYTVLPQRMPSLEY